MTADNQDQNSILLDEATPSFSYLALGDSYTIGERVEASGRWPNQLIDSLEEHEIYLDSATIIAQTGWRTDELKAALATLDKFDYDKIKSTGYSLLDQDENLQEIIVQSLRVLSTLLSQQSSLLENEDGYEILEKYGKKFPDSPNPESYESLFIKANEWMPDSVLNMLNNG